MKLADFGLVHRLRVRWAEADIQGVVFNANYMLYMDVAVTEYFRLIARGETAWLKQIFDHVYVKKSTLEFFAPAHFDEELDIGVRTERIGNSSMVIGFGIFHEEKLLLTAQTIYVYAIDGKPQPIPPFLRERVSQIDAIQWQVGPWETLAASATEVRMAVFVKEQGIDARIELDENDANSQHCVATLCGQPIATGRLLPLGKIGRMAVLAAHRNKAVGAGVLTRLVSEARTRGLKTLELSAQSSAVAFYARHGFQASGPRYEEVGIEHQKMTLQL